MTEPVKVTPLRVHDVQVADMGHPVLVVDFTYREHRGGPLHLTEAGAFDDDMAVSLRRLRDLVTTPGGPPLGVPTGTARGRLVACDAAPGPIHGDMLHAMATGLSGGWDAADITGVEACDGGVLVGTSLGSRRRTSDGRPRKGAFLMDGDCRDGVIEAAFDGPVRLRDMRALIGRQLIVDPGMRIRAATGLMEPVAEPVWSGRQVGVPDTPVPWPDGH